MNDIEKRYDASEEKKDKKSAALKIILWLIGLIFIGSLICLILGVIRAVFSTLVVVAGVLLVVFLLVSWGYERGRRKLLESHDDSD